MKNIRVNTRHIRERAQLFFEASDQQHIQNFDKPQGNHFRLDEFDHNMQPLCQGYEDGCQSSDYGIQVRGSLSFIVTETTI